MKKVVLKLDFVDDKIKQKAMQKVSGLSGLESITFDSKDKKLTVTGDIDPVALTSKLRKLCRAEIVTVGPAKEPEKKKDEPKKDDQPKKDEPKKGDHDKKKDGQKDDVKAYPIPPYYTYNGAYYQQYQPPYHHQPPSYYGRNIVDEDPNSCVIC